MFNKPIRPNVNKNTRWQTLDTIVKESNSSIITVALGNMTQFNMLIIKEDKGMTVGIESHGMYTFKGYSHFTYVAEKLNLLPRDASTVADMINYMNHDMEYIEQGIYRSDLCSSASNE